MPTTTPTSFPSLLEGRILGVALAADINTATDDDRALLMEVFASASASFEETVGRSVSIENTMLYGGSIIVAASFWGLTGEDVRSIVAVIQRDGLVLQGTGIPRTHTAFVLAEFPSRPPSVGPTMYPSTKPTSMPTITPTSSPTITRTLPDWSISTTGGPDLSGSGSEPNGAPSVVPIIVGAVFGLLLCVILTIVVVLRLRRQNKRNNVLTMHPEVKRERKGSSSSILQMPWGKRQPSPPSKPITNVWTTYVGPGDERLDDYVDVQDNGAIEGEYLDHGAEMLADDYFALNHVVDEGGPVAGSYLQENVDGYLTQDGVLERAGYMQHSPRHSFEADVTDGDDSDDGIHVLLDELAASLRPSAAAGQGPQSQQTKVKNKKQKRKSSGDSMAQQVHDRARRSSVASAESADRARRSSGKGKPVPFGQPPHGSVDSADSWNMPQVQTSGMDTLLHRKSSQRSMPRMDDLIQFMSTAAETSEPAPAVSSRSSPKQRRRNSAPKNRQNDALGPMRQMDANGDGKVSKMEFMQAQVSRMQDRSQQRPRSTSPPVNDVRATGFASSIPYSPEPDEAFNSGYNARSSVQASATGSAAHTGFFPRFTGINPAYVQEQQRRQMQSRRRSVNDNTHTREDPFVTFSAAAKSRYLDPVSTHMSPNIEAQQPFAAHLNIPDPLARAPTPSLPTRGAPLADIEAELASPFWRSLPPSDVQQPALSRKGSSSSVHFFPLG